MPHTKYEKVETVNNPKSKYGNKSSNSSGKMDYGYSGGDMKGTSSEKSYYRPMDSYKKGHEY